VGGYGRGELSPHSDIDLLLLTGRSSRDQDKVNLAVRELLYPLWDQGLQVGHAVLDPKSALERCASDLHATTSLLTARLVAGTYELFEEAMDRRARWLGKHHKTVARRINEATAERHRLNAPAGWTLAPDLKEDIGGLRDVHTATWLCGLAGDAPPPSVLLDAARVLMAAREALHLEAGRGLDRIRIDLQPGVASRLSMHGPGGPDLLMAEVHSAARTIEHHASLLTERSMKIIDGGPRRSGSSTLLPGGIRSQDGVLTRSGPQGSVPTIGQALDLFAAGATSGQEISAADLTVLPQVFAGNPVSAWDEDMRSTFIAILEGSGSERALRSMDHVGAWSKLLPEWEAVRGRPQHDPYHRYTVDGHSFLAVALVNAHIETDPLARAAATETGDLVSLRLAALLHDIGKGSGQDHSVAGEALARDACNRMGFPEQTTGETAQLVRHHLLLSDTATRRDISDGAVVSGVATTLGDARILRLLYILSAADGKATGRESWNPWKASLVAELYRKTLVALESGELPPRSDVRQRLKELEAYEPITASMSEELLGTLPPSYLATTSVEDLSHDLKLLARQPKAGEVAVNIERIGGGDQAAVTVCLLDRPGTLARTAGVLSLHRLSVLTAQAYSTSAGLALERFVVGLVDGAKWERVQEDLTAAFSGRLALDARLGKKARDYRPAGTIEAEVRVLQEASEHSTVIEVRARDALGLLFAITSALGELELDIHVAKIDTLGQRVVDVFYVRSLDGGKLDEAQAAEVVQAVQHRVHRFFD
jgi:[protein-PII] uridylyltransferase